MQLTPLGKQNRDGLGELLSPEAGENLGEKEARQILNLHDVRSFPSLNPAPFSAKDRLADDNADRDH